MHTLLLLKDNGLDCMCIESISLMLAFEETSIQNTTEYMLFVKYLCNIFQFNSSLQKDIVFTIEAVLNSVTVNEHKNMIRLLFQNPGALQCGDRSISRSGQRFFKTAEFNAKTFTQIQWKHDICELISHINRYASTPIDIPRPNVSLF